MKDFEDACEAKNIPLYVLPPKRPQYNGGVERMNRTMREDLYAAARSAPAFSDGRASPASASSYP
jgi:transposase InsO family protein